MIKIISPEASVVIHEWMENIKRIPFFQEFELHIVKAKFTIWLMGAVDGVDTESFFCISEVVSTLNSTFTVATITTIVMGFLSIRDIPSNPMCTIGWITCTPCVCTYTITSVLCVRD